ncbi:PC4/YdbC family ssDNA-binding protein [bacterium]|jgi:TPP-dependent indolepyruvate ferredoxin oxidoreductase alpha subunit|nr:PC4/YdbC family ssDNA-binding protein [bacterium]
MIDLDAPAIYEKMIQETEHEQVKLVINTFRETEYISLRKYYLDFDEEWKPSNQGITIPIDMENTRNLFQGLVEILSLAESKAIIEENFKDLLDEIYL